MSTPVNLRVIVADAKRKGYFALGEYPKAHFSNQDILELKTLLDKNNIPFSLQKQQEQISAKQAFAIIDALRRGIPPSEGIRSYSVGREELLKSVEKDLDLVGERKSIVRFLNADVGHGKTHFLYLLRELAYERDFAVSVVTLSQQSCPLYDFMAVYHDIMWGLRIADSRSKPALSNIIDRWVNDIQVLDKSQITNIVENKLPAKIKDIMAAYVAATNIFRPDQSKKQMILKVLSGEKMIKRDLRSLGLNVGVDSTNALQVLSEMATTIRYIGFKGICILFDEAESIHSFARSTRQDQAYANLKQIIQQSQRFPHCYFLYATTPSFINNNDTSWMQRLTTNPLLELATLNAQERQEIGEKIINIYSGAYTWQVPHKVVTAVEIAAKHPESVSIGYYMRRVISILDETRGLNG